MPPLSIDKFRVAACSDPTMTVMLVSPAHHRELSRERSAEPCSDFSRQDSSNVMGGDRGTHPYWGW